MRIQNLNSNNTFQAKFEPPKFIIRNSKKILFKEKEILKLIQMAEKVGEPGDRIYITQYNNDFEMFFDFPGLTWCGSHGKVCRFKQIKKYLNKLKTEYNQVLANKLKPKTASRTQLCVLE